PLNYTIARVVKETIDRCVISANEYGYTEINHIVVPGDKDLELINKQIDEGVMSIVGMLSDDHISTLLQYFNEKGIVGFIRIHFRDLYLMELKKLRAAKEEFIEDEKTVISSPEISVDELSKQNQNIKRLASKYNMTYNQMLEIRNREVNGQIYSQKGRWLKDAKNHKYEVDICELIDNLKIV
ncbi:MAG: hypothetical protein ACRCZ9_03950, partial [Fusobacteriaceae bacterium]